jgi:hypothetical protein
MRSGLPAPPNRRQLLRSSLRDWQFLWWNWKTYGFGAFWSRWMQERRTTKHVRRFYRAVRLQRKADALSARADAIVERLEAENRHEPHAAA